MQSTQTNALVHETSPYLLQHAHNPVNWEAWNKEIFARAKKEDKIVLVSIGYSACHWCHVMEHESFEDVPTANIMNDLFINIKVDREERPDVDQVYMTAVQLMTGRGGWPLNCFVLPDGRPIYGGTYFPKEQWQNILLNIADLWKNDREKILDYAEQLTSGVKQSELVLKNNTDSDFTIDILHETVDNWKERLDYGDGGPNRAPKFPLPNNYLFLLHYSKLQFTNVNSGTENELTQHIHLTLRKMAFGGIYDQLGGGFARYSTDMHWKVPHFEKMLYDNAQLISLYAEAYRATSEKNTEQRELYKTIVYDTIRFVRAELTSAENVFYSALDADTEGVEGKYYVWTKQELIQILGDKFALASAYFNANEKGYWEHENYILLRDKSDNEIAEQFKLNPEELAQDIAAIKMSLLEARTKRTKPGLDDKTLTSWNALMIKALTDSYSVFVDPEFLKFAIKNASFILSKQLKSDGSLYHSYKNGRSTINGFLEDYSFTIEAFIGLYQSTFDETWLTKAQDLMNYSIQHFYSIDTGMFYFTSDLDEALITRKTEITDNVIPASCSSMAISLFILGHYFGNAEYINKSKQMLHNVIADIPGYGAGYSNWSRLLLYFTKPFYEVAIVGKDVDEKRKEFAKLYLPNVIFAGSSSSSELPVLSKRYAEGKTLIYVCENNSCKVPVDTVDAALSLLQVNFPTS